MISTKGRYALRVLVDLAEQGEGVRVPLRDVARRQQISEKYLQHIAKQLVNAGFVVGVSGKGGGYLLARPPEQMTAAEVIEAAEGTLAPVACLAEGAEPCEREPYCKTLPLWRRYGAMMREFLGSVTVADLVCGALNEEDRHG